VVRLGGKQMGLKNRHGADINEFPPQLQIQQFPILNKDSFKYSL